MGKIALVIHGGAGQDSEFIRKNKQGYEEGISEALIEGYKILEKGGTATDAVEAAVKTLEDNPLFNAGKGSAVNAKGQVEMCASIMDGKNLNSGAAAILQNVRNPVSLAKSIMDNTNYRCLGGPGALDYAKKINLDLEVDAYFITEHQYEMFNKAREKEYHDTKSIAEEEIDHKFHGTVGAVALDQEGNLAAATSSGGTENRKEGRVGDSAIIGAGTYANNKCCAVSATGDGEFIIKSVVAASIRCAVEYKNMKIQEACDYILFEENKDEKGNIGVIALDCEGKVAISFNSDRMHRGYIVEGQKPYVKIYR